MKRRYFTLPLLFGGLAAAFFFSNAPTSEMGLVTPIGKGEVLQEQYTTTDDALPLTRAEGFEAFGPSWEDRSFHSDITYLETVLSYGRNEDARLIFILTNAYLTSNQTAYGFAFFERLLGRFGEHMSPELKAHHLVAYAILRASHAEHVSMLKRPGWMFETFDLLDQANALTQGQDAFVRWTAGIIYTQVPWFFFKSDEAFENLNWLAQRPEAEPIPGYYREVYRHLAILHARAGEDELAERYAAKSGYGDQPPDMLFMNWFTVEADVGTQMAAYRSLEEIIPGRVFALYGFGFSDVYVVLSGDGSELIAIDAGTHPGSLREAHEMLLRTHPDLPPIGTLIVTHAHWDHIGGYTYLQEANPDLIIYGRENYAGTLARAQHKHSYSQFRGPHFSNVQVRDYNPDVPISALTEVEIGGSTVTLIPQSGGETEDTLLIQFPDLSTMFAGDILMPYYGEPWVQEGDLDGAIQTMDAIVERQPTLILHGHRPLTLAYNPQSLEPYKNAYAWLLDTARGYINFGFSAKDVIRMNLIPPGFSTQEQTYLAYLVSRDNVIARAADQLVGIWQEDRSGRDPEGLYNLTQVEYGRLFDLYLQLSPKDVGRALWRAIENGDNQLALKLALAAENRFGPHPDILSPRNAVADRLRASTQFFDPFRLVTFSEMTDRQLPQMAPPFDE